MVHWIALILIWFRLAGAQDLPELEPGVQTFLDTYQSKRVFLDLELYNHYYQSPTKSTRAIVFLPGMGEPSLKYYDLTTDLKTDATFYFWDHIGQGSSYHMVPLERQKVHIDSFDTHIRAFTHFLETIRKDHKEIVLIGHSMGGHIALRTLIARPELAEKIVLSAPLMEINVKWVPIQLVSWLVNIVPANYYPPFYSWFKKSSQIGNYTTTSKEKIAIYKKTYTRFPEIKRNGATLGWIRAAQASIEQMHAMDLSKVKTPILLLQAEQDYLVSNPAQTATCKRLPTCELKVVLGSRHELLFETDKPRGQAISWINEFIAGEPAKNAL